MYKRNLLGRQCPGERTTAVPLKAIDSLSFRLVERRLRKPLQDDGGLRLFVAAISFHRIACRVRIWPVRTLHIPGRLDRQNDDRPRISLREVVFQHALDLRGPNRWLTRFPERLIRLEHLGGEALQLSHETRSRFDAIDAADGEGPAISSCATTNVSRSQPTNQRPSLAIAIAVSRSVGRWIRSSN